MPDGNSVFAGSGNGGVVERVAVCGGGGMVGVRGSKVDLGHLGVLESCSRWHTDLPILRNALCISNVSATTPHI